MKELLIGMLVFSFSASIFSAEKKFDGFRDIKWQKPIYKYKDVMKLTSESGSNKRFYARSSDDLYYDEVALASITYVFSKGKFYSAIIQTGKNKKNLKIILSQLKKEHGKPFYSNRYTSKYRWKDKKTAVDFKCYSKTYKCSIIYHSVVMSKKSKKNKK